jgi:hypothetical protein
MPKKVMNYNFFSFHHTKTYFLQRPDRPKFQSPGAKIQLKQNVLHHISDMKSLVGEWKS